MPRKGCYWSGLSNSIVSSLLWAAEGVDTDGGAHDRSAPSGHTSVATNA